MLEKMNFNQLKDELIKINNIAYLFITILATVAAYLIIESIKFSFQIVIIFILIGLIIYIYKSKHNKYIKLSLSTILFVIILFIGYDAFNHTKNTATVRLNSFVRDFYKIEEMNIVESDKCKRILILFKNIQDDDKKSASTLQLDLINKAKECQEKLLKSDDHWKQVNKSYNYFNSSRTLISANEFITAMKQLDDFDKSRSIKENAEYIKKFEEIKADIIKFNEIMVSLKKIILCCRQDDQILNNQSKLEELLQEYENLLIHYKQADLDLSQYQTITAAYEITNSKKSHPNKPEKHKETETGIKPETEQEKTNERLQQEKESIKHGKIDGSMDRASEFPIVGAFRTSSNEIIQVGVSQQVLKENKIYDYILLALRADGFNNIKSSPAKTLIIKSATKNFDYSRAGASPKRVVQLTYEFHILKDASGQVPKTDVSKGEEILLGQSDSDEALKNATNNAIIDLKKKLGIN
jgi:hypothetical protein